MTTATANPALDSDSARHLPGDKDLWIFIFAELLMFGAFFIAYIINRAWEIELFNTSQQVLHRELGVLNTVFLITSSWLVASGARAARQNRLKHVPRYLGGAVLLGIAFMVVKYFEYSDSLGAGITMTTNNFYMFYYCLSGIHLLHVIAGTIILIVLWTNARGGLYHSGNTKGLESGASYWHMVDLLWLFLFPLLYLLR
ncbi:MAG: cytochrome c oxidase subunit 3 [Panacagrimonas sp.]